MKRILLFVGMMLIASGAIAETGVADSDLFTLNTAYLVAVDDELPSSWTK